MRTLLLLLLIGSLSVPNSWAVTCQEAIQVCDRAYQAQKKELELADLALKASEKSRVELQIEVAEKEKSLNSWYRNPWIVGLLGLGVGIAITK